MSDAVIKVEGISKRYRLGLKEKSSDTLMGALGNIVKAPWRNFQRLRNLSKFSSEDESIFWALKDVNFEVKQGEVLGIIGKNGAGKSTLLKILSQITEPTTGRIEITGRVASLLEVGTGFHPELTGRENVYMNGTILGMTRKEIDSKFDEIVDFSGVEKFIDTAVKFYSSGMKVRLGFSVAAHLEPEILIIDEVLAVGDYEFQKKCLGKMEDVAGHGRTVLFVSHSMESIRTLCGRVIILNSGNIFFDGPTNHAIDKYLLKHEKENLTGVWDLRVHPDKKSKNRGVLSARLLRDEQPSNFFYTRDRFVIELDFIDAAGINDLIFGLIFKNKEGVPLVGVNNRDLGCRLNKAAVQKGTVRFEMNSLPFYGDDRYYIDVYFGDGGDNYDTLLNAIEFRMLPTDVLGNGKLLNPKFTSIDPGFVTIKLNS